MFIKLFKRLKSFTRKEIKQKDFERENFQKETKKQFIYLRDKGINLQIITFS